MKKKWLAVTMAALTGSVITAHADDDNGTRLLRYADIHKDKVTFVYAGDVYVANTRNGQAKRLTSHKGFEAFPKFSRDGQRIAFSAEYTGSRQVYVMDVDGGNLKQLTWYNDVGAMPPRGGYDYRILDWSADDKNVLVRANRLPWGVRMGQPYLVPVDGGMETPLAVPETGGGMLSPDGQQFVYTPIDREFRTWKRYRGGRAQDVWVYDLEANSSEQLTDHDATDHQPVWVGDDIFFISDRDYHLNIYQYVKGSEPKKVTNHEGYDALWASAGPEAIVYENGGYLWRYEPGNGESQQLKIHVTANQETLLPKRKNVKDQIESMSLSADGKHILVGARGELFSVPAKNGEIKNISNTPAVRERSVTWSPDGKKAAYLSDQSGEYEIHWYDSQSGQHKQLTDDGTIWRFDPVWSPDGQQLAYSDKNQTLWVVNAKTGQSQSVTRSDRNDITDYAWSPDSGWLTYTKTEANGYASVFVYDLEGKKEHKISAGSFSDTAPTFSSDGQYLFFLSNRDYNLSFSSYEFNYLYNNATRVYAARLNRNVPELFPHLDDRAAEAGQDEDKGDDVVVKVDVKGIENRIDALPFNASNYNALQVNDGAVFVVNTGAGNALQMLSLSGKPEVKTVIKGVANVQIQGEHVLVQVGNKYGVIAAKPDQKINGSELNLKHLTMKIDPKTEWLQMYTDAWRIARDWFYDPNMHGMDWQAVHDKYLPWVQAATHRTDLDYALSEVAGEMNAGHIYVNSGDNPRVKRQDNGLLGAEFTKHKSGYFEISKIFAGENWDSRRYSPLTVAEVGAEEGDFVLAINSQSVKSVDNIYQLLEHTAGRTITLTLNQQPSKKGARDVPVKPIASEAQLRYHDWVESRRAMVDRLSDGRIGYVHLPNTAIEGNRELFKQMLPQIDKDALIIDDRYNGGGFIPDRMIELLSRSTRSYWKRRGLKASTMATPLIAHDGPKVMLANGMSSSGGDALPYYFRQAGLGKVIGTRTWGGLIGISGNPGLADGGSLLVSTFRFMDPDGSWQVENEGVSPDIEVIDRPELIAEGKDPSIERAVQELLKSLRTNPRKNLEAPEAPTEF